MIEHAVNDPSDEVEGFHSVMRTPSKKLLDKILRESSFDPRKPGPMKAIVESATADYLIGRAQEYLKENPRSTENIRRAISLLALVRVIYELSTEDHHEQRD